MVGVSVFSLFAALNSRRAGRSRTQVILGILSVLLGWFVVNTMAALHYAYEYYESPGRGGEQGGAQAGEKRGGRLRWPEGIRQTAWPSSTRLPDRRRAADFGRAGDVATRCAALILIHTVFAFFYEHHCWRRRSTWSMAPPAAGDAAASAAGSVT